MHESEAYYEEILYPLQNGVLTTLAACEAPFCLTGGTALHRHYFGFRYSEDLDLFVNHDTGFGGYVDRALTTLRERLSVRCRCVCPQRPVRPGPDNGERGGPENRLRQRQRTSGLPSNSGRGMFAAVRVS